MEPMNIVIGKEQGIFIGKGLDLNEKTKETKDNCQNPEKSKSLWCYKNVWFPWFST